MNQRYVDTIRACKVIQRNLEHLDESITPAQREELDRVLTRTLERVYAFLEEDEQDEGLWVGEE